MSEPITRADLAALFKYLKEGAFSREMTSLGIVVCNYLEPFDRPAESAPPPRVPGPSAHPGRVGVESGPGQPIDIEALPYCRDPGALAWTKAAAAEIRRLRADLKDIRAAGKESWDGGYRAGIEAAAKVAGSAYSSCAHSKNPTDCAEYNAACFIERTIRALADKPAPDERKRCLEIVQRHIDAEVHATFADGATLQDAFAAGCEMTAKAIFDDIAGTQRFATPIENIDGDVKQERFDAPFDARKGG